MLLGECSARLDAIESLLVDLPTGETRPCRRLARSVRVPIAVPSMSSVVGSGMSVTRVMGIVCAFNPDASGTPVSRSISGMTISGQSTEGSAVDSGSLLPMHAYCGGTCPPAQGRDAGTFQDRVTLVTSP